MKRTIPLLITAVGGFILVASAFIPAAQGAGETVTVWFNILAAIAMVLGGANLAQVQLKVISDRKPGWGYAAIVLASFVITLVVGIGKFGVRPETSSQFPGELWEPIALDAFPTTRLELTDREREVLTPIINRLRQNPPALVASQLEFDEQAISFRGWMNSDQLRDLVAADDEVLWKSLAERLGQAASVPPPFAGTILHRGDRGVLAVIGTISPELASQLTDDDGPISDTDAIARLADRAQRVSDRLSFPLPVAEANESISTTNQVKIEPSGEALDELTYGTVSFEQASVEVVGAMTPASRSSLEGQLFGALPRGGYSPAVARQLAADWGLSSNAAGIFVEAITQPVDVDAIVLAINAASVEQESPRSWTDIAADVEAGDPSPPLVTSIPAVPPASEALIAELKKAAITHEIDRNFSQLIAGLPARQQQGAEAAFVALPTNGVRVRDIAYRLLTQSEIDRETADNMLGMYRIERDYRRLVDSLYHGTQDIKFSYAAGYAKNGSVFWWIYEYLFKPLTATMFSMLAFYISSAAFRAFRAKNLEAGLLLGTAFIVLLGRTFAGVWLTSGLPDSLAFLKIENLTVFIMSVFNTAGNRAIMIGIALGIISTSLKVLLGIDRSYLGKE